MPVVEPPMACMCGDQLRIRDSAHRGLALTDGKLVLNSLPEPLGSKTAIDSFLRSLALDQEECAIGIVLSGTGCHGTLGIAEIKRCGGMAMVQSPESAQFDQMPSSAIKTGLVDFVLAPEQMPETLIRYVRHSYVSRSRPPLFTSDSAVEQLSVVLELILKQTKFDFRNYRPKMIMRGLSDAWGLISWTTFPSMCKCSRSSRRNWMPCARTCHWSDIIFPRTGSLCSAGEGTFSETCRRAHRRSGSACVGPQLRDW